MKPRIICFDLDDTVFNFSQMVCRTHNLLHSTTVTHFDLSNWDYSNINVDGVKGEDLIDTYKKYESHGLYSILQPLEYAKQALDLSRLYGYKIYFLTARDVKYDLDTRLCLLHNHLPFDEIIYNWDKVAVLKELKKSFRIDLFVDDKAKTVNAVAESGLVKKVCLLSNAANKTEVMTDEVVKVTNLNEAVRFLKDLR